MRCGQGADGIKLVNKWPLLSDKERKDNWRISGYQNIAIHHDSNRAYVLMHQGGPETRQEPGTEVWVYDLKTHARVSRFELKEQSIAISVSQGAAPRLYSIDFIVPMPLLAKLWVYFTKGQDGIMKVIQQGITIYDANSGKLQHQIDGLPFLYMSAILPW